MKLKEAIRFLVDGYTITDSIGRVWRLTDEGFHGGYDVLGRAWTDITKVDFTDSVVSEKRRSANEKL